MTRAGFLLAAMTLGLVLAQARAQEMRVERLAVDHWRITLRNDPPSIGPADDDASYSRVTMPGHFIQHRDGQPQLPIRSLTFGLPAGASLSASITVGEEAARHITLHPWHSAGVPLSARQASAPVRPAALSAPTFGRRDGLRTATITITPAWYDAPASTLTWVRSAVVDVRLTGVIDAPGTGRAIDGDIVNAVDAAAWHEAGPRVSGMPWYTPGEPMLKITTRATGIHRITRADMAAAGVPVQGLDPRSLRLLVDGVEQPVLVRGEEDGRLDEGDAVEFFLRRRPGGDGEWFDEWSDDNTAWLLWGGQGGLRFGVEDGTPAGGQPMTETMERLHLEEDHLYHAGDNDYESAISEKVAGETWIWSYLRRYDSLGVRKTDSLVIPFSIDALAGTSTLVTLRLKGSSRDMSLVALTLNGVRIDSVFVDGREIVTRSVRTPEGVLHTGANRLVIRALGAVACPPTQPNCSIERVYVDWIDLRHTVPLAARAGVVFHDREAMGDTVIAPQRVRAMMTGFRDSVTILNLTRGTIVRGARVEPAGDSLRVDCAIDADASIIACDARGRLTPTALALTTIPDIDHAPTGADYIIVTAPPFRQAAARLAAHRAAIDTFRTVIVDVGDIYNAHRFGHKHPGAITAFLRTAHDTWPAPAPRYVLMLGDASWDPKYHLPNAVNVDHVPTTGNPANDNAFVAFDTLAPYRPIMSIGRIPAQTSAEADQVVDKVIAYETALPQAWNRRLLFAIGGKSTYERDTLFRPHIDATIRKWIAPACTEPRMILKRRLDIVSYDDLDTLISEMNNGVLWFNFVGHGGTRIIDMGVERPDIFATGGRLPFFVTWSCNTAHFAEPYETGLNEKFVMAAGNGSIASYGTSGLGVVSYDEALSDGCFRALFERNVRRYGDMSLFAKQAMLDAGGLSSQFAINTVNQYIVLGDPATHIALASKPELAVEAGDITSSPAILSESTPTVITTRLHNHGLCLADSIDVVLRMTQGTVVLAQQQRRIEAFGPAVDLPWSVSLARITGQVRFTVTIDPDRRISEGTTADNTAWVDRVVLPRGVVPVFPLDNAVHSAAGAAIRFSVANPAVAPPDAAQPVVRFQMSTTQDFTGVVRDVELPMQTTYTSHDWVPEPGAGSVWYWRARAVSSAGAEEWSPTRSLTLDAGTVDGDVWRQHRQAQFMSGVMDALAAGADDTVRLGVRPAVMEVVSAGNNQIEIQDFAEIWVDGRNVAPNRRGFNVAVIDGRRGTVRDTTVFDTYAFRDHAAAMAALLRSLPDEDWVAIAIRDDANGTPEFTIGGTNITPELKDALKLFGAQSADSIGFRDSYALFARKGDPLHAREMHRRYGPAFFKDTLTVNADRGLLRTTVIGPAGEWRQVRWDGVPGGAGSALALQLIDAASDSVVWSPGPVSPGVPLDVQGIDPARHPLLRLVARFSDSLGNGSPALGSLQVMHLSEFAEFGINSQSVALIEDSVEQGRDAEIEVLVRNIGRRQAVSLPVRLAVTNGTGADVDETRMIDVPIGGAGRVRFTVPTASLPGESAWEVRVDPAAVTTEYHRGNDVYTGRMHVRRDGGTPTLDVAFDGAVLVDGDYVAPTPTIMVVVRDAGPLPITDTSAVQLFLDGRRIWLQGNPLVEFLPVDGGEEKVRIRYTPTLSKGYHTFSATAKDASGNPADTIPYQVRFIVRLDNAMEQVWPYPNPASGPVDFTLVLTGAEPPSELRIRIHTVAGRLIRSIVVPREELRIGFNRIRWNGMDEDDNRPGNGVYFYRITVTRVDGDEEIIGKLSILR